MASSLGFSPDRPAVIVGMETNGLGVARALAAGGVTCLGLSGPEWNSALWSRTCRTTRLSSWDGATIVEGLIDLARRVGASAPLPLLITKDEPVLWVNEARDELKKHYAIRLPAATTVDLLMNKQRFQALAEAKDWPTPRTWRSDDAVEFDAVSPSIVYPCILKPQVKNSTFRLHAPRKAFRATSPDELRDAYRLVSQWESEVVIQEWIEGDDDRIAYCVGYCVDGEPLGMFVGRKLRQYPIDCGNTALCEPAPAAWRERLIDLTRAIWRETGYCGLGSVEYKMRLGADEPVIMEPTVGRTNYQNESAVINGVNLPLIAYCEAAGLPIPAVSPLPHPVKLIDGPAERKAAHAYIAEGRLSVEGWKRDRSGPKKDMLWRADDPGPFLAEASRRLLEPARWIRRGLLRVVRLGKYRGGVSGPQDPELKRVDIDAQP